MADSDDNIPPDDSQQSSFPSLPPVPSGQFLFVSYASVDRSRVLAIADHLQKAGIQLWIDQAGIAGGEVYGTEIVNAIKGSAAVALMCSAASLASRNVRQEILLAWRYDTPILPLLLEPTTFPDDVAYWLEGAQWIEVLDRPSASWLPDVARALRRHGLHLGGPVETTSPSPQSDSETPPPAAGNLPAPTGPLIGREREVRELLALLEHGRWVTLTGPGGTGKTTLATDIARRLDLADGAWLVDLAAISDSGAVLPAIATTLDVPEEAGRSVADLLAHFLAEKQLLLLLDNMEQVAEGAAYVAELSARCPSMVVVATSRVPLKVPDEWIYAVGQLDLPDPANLPPLPILAGIPAIRLFVERAQEARRDFVLTEGMAQPVAEICRRLDGLPLAIELAAARVRLLSPPAILTRLGSALTLLTRGGGSARHQTLRNTIAWSHDLLSESERSAFRRLAVFAGGAGVEAAETVLAQVPGEPTPTLDDIDALVDDSLVRIEHVGEFPRVRMLETIREFASEQLAESGEEVAVRTGHASWFLTFAEARQADLYRPTPGPALGELRQDDNNLRAALDWLGTHPEAIDPDAELRLAAALTRYWRRLGRYAEAAKRGGDALERRPSGDPVARVKLLHSAGFVAGQRGDLAAAMASHEEALQISRAMGDRVGEATALLALAEVTEYAGNYTSALELREQVLALQIELGDEGEIAAARHDLGVAEMFLGDYGTAIARFGEAIPVFRKRADARNLAMALTYLAAAEILAGHEDAVRHSEESLMLWRTLDDRYALAYATVNYGRALQLADRHDQAIPELERALSEFRDLDDTGGISLALYGLGGIALVRGDLPTAYANLSTSLRLVHDAGQQWHVAERLEAVAAYWAAAGDAERAARLLGGAARMRADGGFPLPPAEQVEHDETMAAITAIIGSEACLAAMDAARDLDGDDLVALAEG